MRPRPRAAIAASLLLLLLPAGPPAAIRAADLPPVEMVDDGVAGEMVVTLSGAVKARRTLGLRFVARSGPNIEIQASTEQTLTGNWGRVQLILPAQPGTWPLSTEVPDGENGVGYLDWGISGLPHAAPGCSATYTERDGIVSGTLLCERQPLRGKKTFTLSATYTALPTDPWRLCLPGWILADDPGVVASAPTVASPAPGASPSTSPSPGLPAPIPTADVAVALLAAVPRCVPEGEAAPPPVIDACALVDPAALEAAAGISAAGLTIEPLGAGVCRVRSEGEGGLLLIAAHGFQPRPLQLLGGARCEHVETDLPLPGTTETSCGDFIAGPTWEILGTVSGTVGIRVVAAWPALAGWQASSVMEELAAAAVERLP